MPKLPSAGKDLSSFHSLPVFALTIGLLLSACASPARNMHGLSPERAAQLEGICAKTMNYSPGNTRFEDCMDVLSDTAKRLDTAQASR
jgi:starvation-inducible outer membrane lipoprotein